MKRIVSLVLVVLMVGLLVACGSDGSSSDSVSQSSSSQGGQSQSSSESIPEPEPEPEPLNQAYLTGLSKDASYPEGQRIFAVMLNNVPEARPQEGISEAQILVEIETNWHVPRFMALYEDYTKLPRVGGIRSARDQFLQLIIPSQAFFMHDGPGDYTHPVNIMLREYTYESLDLYAGGKAAWKYDSSRNGSHYSWEYVDGDTIESIVANHGLDDYKSYNSPFFHFVSYNEPARVPAEGMIDTVEVNVVSSYISFFEYNAASGKYAMSMNNGYGRQWTPATDANNGEQVSFNNVIVIFAPFSRYPDSGEDLPKVDYSQGGGGFYFSNGGWERFIWRKGAPFEPLQLYDIGTGELLQINTGTSYLAVVDETASETFYQSLLSGWTGQTQGSTGDNGGNMPAD